MSPFYIDQEAMLLLMCPQDSHTQLRWDEVQAASTVSKDRPRTVEGLTPGHGTLAFFAGCSLIFNLRFGVTIALSHTKPSSGGDRYESRNRWRGPGWLRVLFVDGHARKCARGSTG